VFVKPSIELFLTLAPEFISLLVFKRLTARPPGPAAEPAAVAPSTPREEFVDFGSAEIELPLL
jgi:hypothetical protein